ncbi:hypothetical protein RDI58_020048 [Solanum bulbocastanum]|uniref:Neprosin PEP catalytic domain-containing protein n=1 Tax=Solanum bulbocastanum TaxID=147425 RepID=A0AAN8TBT7_SOLBU
MTTSLWNPLVKAGNQLCFNTLCPGFVVVNTEIPVDTTFNGMSHRGDEALWEETMAFTKGGVVYSPPGVPEPLMGSNYLPLGKTGYDAYCRGLTIINDKGETIDVDRVITHVDNPNLYQIMDVPHLRPGKYQHFVLYG